MHFSLISSKSSVYETVKKSQFSGINRNIRSFPSEILNFCGMCGMKNHTIHLQLS